MKTTITLLAFLIGSVLAAQNVAESGKQATNTQFANEYSRISMTYLLLDLGSGQYYNMAKQAFKQVEVPDKFDDNSLGQSFVQSPLTRNEITNSAINHPNDPNYVASRIQEAIGSGHFVNSILAKWFSRKSDGSFGVELLQERGLYNATDADVLAAQASQLGMAKIKDTGEKLLNNTYLIVFDISDLMDMNEYYNRLQKQSNTPITRNKDGFYANATSYVFKINFNESVSAAFWQQLWANPGDPDLARKKAAFNNFDFPISFVTKTSKGILSDQNKPGTSELLNILLKTPEELMARLVQSSINSSLVSLESISEQFQVKTQLYTTNPLRAKIGKKEGLRTDQRYFVYEKVQNSQNQILERRRGIIRAKRVEDNRMVASGKSNPSDFYQSSGVRLDEGMVLKQNNDFGTSVSLGYSTGGVNGIDYRIEIRLSRFIPIPLLKVFVEGGIESASYGIGVVYEDFIRYGGGLGKEICFLRNLKWQPFIGAGFEKLSNRDNADEYYSSYYVHPGFIFGLNMLHNLQLTWQCGSYIMNGITKNQDSNEMTINGKENWGEIWNRGGLTNTFGIRYEL